MNSRGNQGSDVWKTDYMRNLYRRHVQGALVRSGASLLMWLFALGSFWAGGIQINNFMGISASIAYLVLINPPTLWILKRTTQINSFKYISLLINILEVIGYTAIIYFLGGIQSTNLILIYGALITYVGIVGTRRLPFVVASFCSICFGLMVVLEHVGFLPRQDLIPNYYCPWKTQLAILSAAIGLLFVTAFIASHTANLLKRNREKLRRQNAELVFTNERLQKEIAERERVKKELQHERMVLEERAEDLVKAKEVAENANRAKSDFLADVSHELRTPLNHIIGFTELVLDKQFGDLNEVQGKYLNDALQSSRHLLSLINDISDLWFFHIHY
jgi:signal transduction histidine kinase